MAVRLGIRHSVLIQGTFSTEKNFPTDLTIAQLKKKLEPIVGTAPEYQRLSIRDPVDRTKVLSNLTDDNRTLGSYNPLNDQVLFVEDLDPNQTVSSLQDMSKLERFELTDEQYDSRENTVRRWKQQQEKEGKKFELPPSIKVGDRCIVKRTDELEKRGLVMYVGIVDFAEGYWVGVQLDEPMGKNDGSVQGKRYFVCEPKYGTFVKPAMVTVGDYPALDLDDEL